MIDEFTEGQTADIKPRAQLEAEEQGLIRLHDANFYWGTENGSSSPRFGLRIPDLTFVKGKINLITGATGSGKSTLLKVSSPILSDADIRLLPVNSTLKSYQEHSSISHEKVESVTQLKRVGACRKVSRTTSFSVNHTISLDTKMSFGLVVSRLI